MTQPEADGQPEIEDVQPEIEQDGGDLLLRTSGSRHPRVRLLNFLVEKRYQHLQVRDKNGETYQLGEQEGKVHLYQGNLQAPEEHVGYVSIAVDKSRAQLSEAMAAFSPDALIPLPSAPVKSMVQQHDRIIVPHN